MAAAVANGVVEGVGAGRLDMMGGVGDYSGGLVLEVATKRCTRVRASVDAGGDRTQVRMGSDAFGEVTLPLQPVLDGAASHGAADRLDLPAYLATVRRFLGEATAPSWVFYVYGCLAAFAWETGWTPASAGGQVSLIVTSDVPASQGVSSSASVEVATLRCLGALSGLPLHSLRLAHVAQAAENYAVGAPCGLMDQLSSALGTPGEVLPILCRPDVCSPCVPLPSGVCVVGWPSGVKHSVSGSPYLTARTATFMGRKIAEAVLGRKLAHVTELTPSEYRNKVDAAMPAAISGADFIARFGGVDDALSRVEPGRTYSVQAAMRFPIEENFRCSVAATLLRHLAAGSGAEPSLRRDTLTQVGQLMQLTHAGYNAIGLGAPETDIMVEKLMALGPDAGIYGARISGGGSGGTVAVLCERTALVAVEALARATTFDEPFSALIE
jgi:galactokinase